MKNLCWCICWMVVGASLATIGRAGSPSGEVSGRTGADAKHAALRLVLFLSDGSLLRCAPCAADLAILTASGKKTVPLCELQEFQSKGDHETYRFLFRNGDTVSGSVDADTILVDTALGRLSVPANLIARCVIQSGGRSGANSLLRIEKDIYRTNEPIVVQISGLPGNSGDWITVTRSDTPDSQYGEWFYTQGRKEGTWTFKGLPAGQYEARVYFDWPTGRYEVQDRVAFRVSE